MSFAPARFPTMILAGIVLVGIAGHADAQPLDINATPSQFVEGGVAMVSLDARYSGVPSAHQWQQTGGPKVTLMDLGPTQAVAIVHDLRVAVDTELVLELTVTINNRVRSGEVVVHVQPADLNPPLGPHVQIGGSSVAVAPFKHLGGDWVVYNVGAKLSCTRVGHAAQPVHSVQLSGFVQDILVVNYGGLRYALAATGNEGVAVVDISEPTAPAWKFSVGVNYFKDGLTWTEGGGDILTNQVIAGTKGTITSLATDGFILWIGNADYGIHRTALVNLLGAGGPIVEADGTLAIDHEAYTLLYAGEVPWGAPKSLKLVQNRLFAAVEFLGMGIYDPGTLARVGHYNMYTDVSVVEDWFLDLDVTQAVQPGFVDPDHGMPNYQQASYEIANAHGSGGASIDTPWADFDRYGKYYYNSNALDVVDYGSYALAYIAYGLGGLVAVDVTGFQVATSSNPLEGTYVAYVPAVPAHGPDEFIGSHNDNIYPHFGAGMLKEAGTIDVQIRGRRAFYTDHFAGLVVLLGAFDPATYWRGAAAPYDNDNGVVGDHNPDYEFVSSFDMSPYDPNDHESLPTWMYAHPSVLVTGEIGGHGNAMTLLPKLLLSTAGNTDVAVCVGAGGLEFVDIVDLRDPVMANRFDILAHFPTTDEIGAAPDGSPTEAISIGHSAGITASSGKLYLADGPHGVSAWNLVDDQGFATDDLHLVANTVQDEYPVDVAGTTIYPATHAYGVVYDPVKRVTLALCQGVGLRRIDVAAVEDGLGHIGVPLLIAPEPRDIFEHNGEWGKIHATPKQDHAYDVALDGDLAYVADGGNGLTIYDLTKDPTDPTSGFFVSNLGGATKERPMLGRSTGIALWTQGSFRYALMAAGPYGVGVVDVTDPTAPALVKIFEPIKLEDLKVGKADGRCVDVFVDGDHAWFTYDSFGVLCYRLTDLVQPLPPGVDPTKIWKVQNGVVLYDYRPIAVGEFRLREEPGYEDWGGGALNMTYTRVGGERVLYVAYGVAGVVKIVWSDPAAPNLATVVPTVGECSAIAIANGRLYAADGAGGLAFFN